MKASKENFRKICEVYYNLTGLEYWLSAKFTFSDFWYVLSQCRDLIKSGLTYQFPIYSFNTKELKPYIGNSINLF